MRKPPELPSVVIATCQGCRLKTFASALGDGGLCPSCEDATLDAACYHASEQVTRCLDAPAFWKAAPTLTSALSDARDRCAAVLKSWTADVKKAGRTLYKYDFASADDVVRVARDALVDSGLAIVPKSFRIELGLVPGDREVSPVHLLKRVLEVRHTSGESIDCEWDWPIVLGAGRTFDTAMRAAATGSLNYFTRDLLLIPRAPQDEEDFDATWNVDGRGRHAGRGQPGQPIDTEPAFPRLSAKGKKNVDRVNALATPGELAKAEEWFEGLIAASVEGPVPGWDEADLKALRVALDDAAGRLAGEEGLKVADLSDDALRAFLETPPPFATVAEIEAAQEERKRRTGWTTDKERLRDALDASRALDAASRESPDDGDFGPPSDEIDEREDRADDGKPTEDEARKTARDSIVENAQTEDPPLPGLG